jgi:hypothetical protein
MSTGPEALLEILLSGEFAESICKAVVRVWASEAGSFLQERKGKDSALQGCLRLASSDHRLHTALGQSDLLCHLKQEPAATLRFNLQGGGDGGRRHCF